LLKNKRGGYCLELNPLFGWLLEQLGYNVNLAEASLFIYESGKFYKRPVHIILIVELDEKLYYVDAGTSRPINEPIEVKVDLIQKQALGTFRFSEYEQQSNVYLLERSKNGDVVEWRPLMIFKLEYKKFNDFHSMNEYVQAEGNTTLYYNTLITKQFAPNKLCILYGYKFSQIEYYENDEIRQEEVLQNDEQVKQIIKEKFNIELDFDKLNIKAEKMPIENF
jgi:N-hydroxyarylamine O-acetyltransferase